MFIFIFSDEIEEGRHDDVRLAAGEGRRLADNATVVLRRKRQLGFSDTGLFQ